MPPPEAAPLGPPSTEATRQLSPYRVTDWVSRDGRWRIDQLRVEREGRRLLRLRVCRNGYFVAEVAGVDPLAALGVPVAELVEEDESQRPSCVFGEPSDDTWGYPSHGRDTTLGAERPSVPEWRARGC